VSNRQRIIIWLSLLVPPFLILQTNFPQAHKFVIEGWPQTLTQGDQYAIWVSAKDAFERNQVPLRISSGWLSAGYLANIGFYHKVASLFTSTNVDASFVYNNLFYAALAAFLSILLMYRASVDQAPNASRVWIAVSCALFWAVCFKLSGILRFVFIPWSHYSATCLGVGFILCFYEIWKRPRLSVYFWFAFTGTLLFYMRRHEAVGLFLACFLVASLLWAQKPCWPAKKNWVWGSLGLSLGIGMTYAYIFYFSNTLIYKHFFK